MGLTPQAIEHTSSVSRNAVQTFAFPSYWVAHPYDSVTPYFHLLPESHPEYNYVKTLFNAASDYVVLSIHVVQAPALYVAYKFFETNNQRSKSKIKGYLPPAKMWHGTHPRYVKSIAQGGFRREYTTTYAYGYGVYFAKQSSYSASSSYSKPDDTNVQRMFLCDVVRGVPEDHAGSALTPRPIPGHAGLYYDSFCDSPSDPNIIATPNDHQAYPLFLVSFCSNHHLSAAKAKFDPKRYTT